MRLGVAMCCAVAVMSGCASNALIRPDDPMFRAGQTHLQSSLQKSAPHDAPDRVLFAQAESFFHYRVSFERPSSPLLYALELAAAATDFTPLSVAATSGSHLDLRLQTYNGAAELYEALLARYPDSPLAPEALYRLGWVYRNTTEEGFPRDADQALQELPRRYPSSPLVPLAEAARHVAAKSQDTAALLSLLPGAGQLYVGETGNGLVRLGIALAFTAMILFPSIQLARLGHFAWGPTILATAGLIGLQLSYTAAYEDAQRAVVQFNETQEAGFLAAHPDAPP